MCVCVCVCVCVRAEREGVIICATHIVDCSPLPPPHTHTTSLSPQVFVEMEELRADSAEHLEWEETARWIKFEEDVEEGTGRWGRPHISALAFHSLVDLRKGLDQG